MLARDLSALALLPLPPGRGGYLEGLFSNRSQAQAHTRHHQWPLDSRYLVGEVLWGVASGGFLRAAVRDLLMMASGRLLLGLAGLWPMEGAD